MEFRPDDAKTGFLEEDLVLGIFPFTWSADITTELPGWELLAL